MKKYTKKEQRFISSLYGNDLERLIPCIDYANEEQQKDLHQVVKFARELINGDTSNTERMFKISFKLEDDVTDAWNHVSGLYDEGKLTKEKEVFYKQIHELMSHIEILNNLHPDRILTWDDVKRGYM